MLIRDNDWTRGVAGLRPKAVPEDAKMIPYHDRHKGGAFVYFLCADGKVIYVGQTVNLKSRMECHKRAWKFDAVFVLKCVAEIAIPHLGSDVSKLLDIEERRWISELKPTLNIAHLRADSELMEHRNAPRTLRERPEKRRLRQMPFDEYIKQFRG